MLDSHMPLPRIHSTQACLNSDFYYPPWVFPVTQPTTSAITQDVLFGACLPPVNVMCLQFSLLGAGRSFVLSPCAVWHRMMTPLFTPSVESRLGCFQFELLKIELLGIFLWNLHGMKFTFLFSIIFIKYFSCHRILAVKPLAFISKLCQICFSQFLFF